MRFLLLIALACLSGCRMALIPMPSGKTAYVGSLLTDPHWTSAKINPDGSVELVGYDSKIDEASVQAITAGVVEGVVKGIKP